MNTVFIMQPKNGANPLKVEVDREMTKQEIEEAAKQIAEQVKRKITDFEIKYNG